MTGQLHFLNVRNQAKQFSLCLSSDPLLRPPLHNLCNFVLTSPPPDPRKIFPLAENHPLINVWCCPEWKGVFLWPTLDCFSWSSFGVLVRCSLTAQICLLVSSLVWVITYLDLRMCSALSDGRAAWTGSSGHSEMCIRHFSPWWLCASLFFTFSHPQLPRLWNGMLGVLMPHSAATCGSAVFWPV